MRKKTDYIFIHCSATKPSMDVDAKEIDRWHRARGFLKIGYHFVIKRDGTKEIGRELMESGAHVKSYNHKSIGIAMIGGVAEIDVNQPEDDFTEQQWLTLENLINDLRKEFPNAKIKGHNEVSKKACPSFDVQQWLYKVGINKAKPVTTPEEKQEILEGREKLKGKQGDLFGNHQE